MTKTETHTNKTILRVLLAALAVLMLCGAAVGAGAGVEHVHIYNSSAIKYEDVTAKLTVEISDFSSPPSFTLTWRYGIPIGVTSWTVPTFTSGAGEGILTINLDGTTPRGDYEFTLTDTISSAYGDGSLDVDERPIEVDWTVPSGPDAVYDGKAKTVTAEPRKTTKLTTLEVTYKDAADNPVSAEDLKNAGTYTAAAAIPEGQKDNYVIDTGETQGFTISPLEAVLSWETDTFTYDGEEHVPTATVGNLISPDTCTVTVTGAATEVGDYTATATKLSNTNYKLPSSVTHPFKITKPTPAASDFTCIAPSDLVYSKTAKSATVNTTIDELVGKFSVKYLKNGVETSPIDVGTYSVVADTQETDHYAAAAVVVGSFEITAKDITGAAVTLEKNTMPYNGTEQSVSVSSVSIPDSWVLESTDYDVTGNTATDVGEYSVTVTGKGNYTGTASANWNITQKPVTVTWPETKSFKWDDTEKTIEAIGDFVTGDDVRFTYTDNKKTDAGNYTAKIIGLTGSKAGNYSLPTTPADLECSWSIVKEKYTVSFAGNKPATASGTVDGIPEEITADDRDPIAAPTSNPTLTGHTFGGWYKEPACTNEWKFSGDADPDTVTENTTLYAKWTPNQYTVKFNANGGSKTMADQSFTYDAAQELTPNEFTRAGYTFAGWDTDSAGTTVIYTDKQSVSNLTPTPNGEVTLYAVWTVNKYTVSFDMRGHGTQIDPVEVIFDNAVTRPSSEPKAVGHTFGGWYKEADCTNEWKFSGDADPDKVTEDTTIYAKWTADIPSYTITFNGNGGSVTPPPLTVKYGDTVNLGSVNVGTRSGYTHSGWALSPTGPAVYAAKQSVKDLGNITLYVVWAPVEKQRQLKVIVKHGGAEVTGAAVKLRKGDVVINETPTESEGTYTFTYVPEGVYTIEASNNGKTKTKSVTISGDSEIEINLPSGKNVNSKVSVKSDAGTPAVAVDGADTLAEKYTPGPGESITVTVIVESKTDGSAPEAQKEIDAIKEKSTLGTKVEYLGITIEKKTEKEGGSATTEPITNTENVLEFLIPYDFTNKTEIKLYRCHNDNGELVVKPLELGNAAAKEDGKYWLDTAKGLIHLYSKKFSTYSVGYKNAPSHSRSSSSQGSSTWAQPLPPVTDDNTVSTDVTNQYTGQKFIPVSAANLEQITAADPAAAAAVEAALQTAAAAGIPVTNSKGAKAIVASAESIPGAQTETFAQVIEVTSADGSKVTSVPFTVRLSDLTAKNLTTDDVTLYHYLEEYGIWIPLETRLVSTDDGYAYYEAETDGASPFGVLLKKLDIPEVKPLPTQTGKTPVPFAGVLAGLGAAGVLMAMRQRR